ncbi:uncharacterized protein VICG_00055 [Vittaforma corneae ATCC 50505]|uniref:AMP-dependent synthetase/ligase domain-containing protein n=1 Tax=Vittaforma corneae (strain ATCC 50505) TaxID=993615 RepID=L2GQF8_VITCO|nr:uncharacterized protein VICG_00055 [Vittaforma corneae ATCC 50505]ELA42740.1 hypothetical protein VICG_00055 [Vittaforma corneae ATCC 50505]
MPDYLSIKDNIFTHVGFNKLRGSLKNGEKTLLEMLKKKVEHSPTSKIFGTINKEGQIDYIDYQTMDRRARRFAVFLETITKEREIVGIASVSRVEWLITEYATYYANCINAPVYSTFTPPTLASLINMTKMNIIVASLEAARELVGKVYDLCETHKFKHIILMDDSQELVEMCQKKGINVSVLSNIVNNNISDSSLAKNPIINDTPTRPSPKYNDLASICFTSGTSGDPKGVELTHSNFIAQLEAFQIGSRFYDIVEITQNDAYISYLPLAHVFERICVCICILEGCRIGFYRGSREKLAEDYKIIKPTFVAVVPKVLKLFRDTIEKKVMERRWYQRAFFRIGMAYKIFLQRFGIYKSWIWDAVLFGKIANLFGGQIRSCLCGGAAVNPDLIKYMQAILSANIFQGYGQTEGLGANLLSVFSSTDVASVGIPFISTMIKLEDLPEEYPRSYKKLLMNGPAISRGYFNQKKRGDNEWLDTGDVVKFENNRFYILGRYKDQIKIGNGEYIDPETLENYLLEEVKDIDNIYITIKPGQIDLIALVVCKMTKTEETKNNEETVACWIQSALDHLKNEGKIGKFVSIHHFVLIDQDFSEVKSESGLVTASMKKRRVLIDRHFSHEIDEAYRKKY